MKKKITFALLMGIVTTGLISYVLLSVNTDYSGNKFLTIWLKSWAISYGVVIPCILLISPMIEKVVNKMMN